MTLDMLDLQYNPETRFYDAPLHVKAINGMMLIDDFGRQKFAPNELLNRWIVPMENQVDFLKLITGASFSLPFDVLLIFSTNLQPADLMDAGFPAPHPIQDQAVRADARGIPPDLRSRGQVARADAVR